MQLESSWKLKDYMKLESSVAYNVFVEIRKTLKVQTYLLSQNFKKLVESFLPKSAIYINIQKYHQHVNK